MTTAKETTTGTCTIPGCGRPAAYVLTDREGEFVGRECADCFTPVGTQVATDAAEKGMTVLVTHCGAEKVGTIVKATPTKVHVRVTTKPHGRDETTKVIVRDRTDVRFVR